MAGSLCSGSIWDSGLVPQEEDEKGIPHLKSDEGWQLANRMEENRERWCFCLSRNAYCQATSPYMVGRKQCHKTKHKKYY